MAKSNVIEVSASSASLQPSTGFVVTLEGTNLLLTITLSLGALLAIVIRSVSKFNEITSKIRDLQEDLNTHSSAKGHTQLLQQVELIQTNLLALDRKIDLHLSDYTHYKDLSLLHVNGIEKQIKHNWEKTDRILIEYKGEIKELQRFLQKSQEFKIRE